MDSKLFQTLHFISIGDNLESITLNLQLLK